MRDVFCRYRYAKVLASNTYLLFMSYDRVYEAIDREYEKLAISYLDLEINKGVTYMFNSPVMV